MSHYATLRDYQFKDRTDDIRGTTLYGVDGDKLGTIDDVIFEHGSGTVKYCVVDTGGWLSSHKFLVPAERIHSYDKDRDAQQVDLLKEHIEKYFPPYDEKNLDRDDNWRDYEGRYNRAATDNRVWDTGPVLHREGSNRIITPDDVEAEGGGADVRGADVTPHRIAGKFPSTMPGAGKVDLVPKGTRPVERTMSAGNESFVPPEGEPTFKDTREFGNLEREDRPVQHHHHTEGKVEDISSSPEFRPEADTPLGSMGEEIQPIAEPNVRRPAEPVVEVGARDRDLREQAGPGPAMTGRLREDAVSRPERWRRFEDLLRKNRVDIEAKCAQCAPARDRKVS
jgi:sporulation protein YlmC with PRC-barrel domain